MGETGEAETAASSTSGDGDAESESGGHEGACTVDPPPALPGPPLDPLVCGTWEPEPLAPPSSPAPTTCGDGGPCPTFRDVTVEAGLTYAQYVPTSPDASQCVFDLGTDGAPLPNVDCEPQWSTGGAAVADFDLDGWPDLYVTRLGAPDLLFRNRGDGGFEEVGAEVGLGACTFTNGATWADVDDDGDPDLAVTALGGASHHLFINEDGCFADEAAARGFALTVDGLHGGESVTFGDYDLDGDLDAHVDEWIDDSHSAAAGTWGARLLRNDGTGTFEDVTEAAGVSIADIVPYKDGAWAFASTFVDLDEDGWPELAVTVDFGEARVFWNRGDGGFDDAPETTGVGTEGNAMGSTFGDFDGDGRLDWFVTAIGEQHPDGCPITQCKWRGSGNRLYRNLGGRRFEDVTEQAGVRDGGWAWGAAFFDADHDADLDLVATNGWPGRGVYQTLVHLDTPMRLWLAEDGVFSERGGERGITDTGQGRGLLTFDYDRDGDLDVFVANHAGRPVLYRNEGAEAVPWLVVEVTGTTSNRDARGAVVSVTAVEGGPTQVRHVGVGSHFLGEGELAAHFGLADATSVHEIRVAWPASGRERVLEDVAASQRVHVVEP